MDIAIAVVALLVALWQLKLQRDEIRRNSRLNALIHIAGLTLSETYGLLFAQHLP